MRMTPEEHDAMCRPEIEQAALKGFPPGLLYRSAVTDIETQDATPEEKARRREFWLVTIRQAYGRPAFDGRGA